MIMAQAYLKNIEELTSKEVLFRFLFKLYPDLEKTKALNLITTTEIQDYFYNFNNDII
jgi:hypothetical protein